MRYADTGSCANKQDTGIAALLHDSFEHQDKPTKAIIRRILATARQHFRMDIAFISELTEEDRIFRYVDKEAGIDAVPEGGCDPLEESYCQRVIDGRLPELIEDARKQPEARKLDATWTLGVGAHMSCPIRLNDGSIFGTFCCFSFKPDAALNEKDTSLLHAFADIAGELVDESVQNARQERLKRRRIRNLIDDDKFHMVWQPIIEIATGRMSSVESLARFPREPHPSPPGWFNEAGSIGLSNELEVRAMEKGLAVLEELAPDAYVTCNASANAMVHGDGAAALSGMPLGRIVLEITEHDVVNDYGPLREVLTPLRARGLRIAVDDAGAGYASFKHILQLKPDLIKLDMSLTRDIDSDISRRSLATALVQFSREIGSRLVAEGVETQAELDTLFNLGVDMAQGYFLHKPMPIDDLHQLIQTMIPGREN